VQSGYPVYVKEALGILEQTAPEAAMWWRENVPHEPRWRREKVRSDSDKFPRAAHLQLELTDGCYGSFLS
jgi:hypothetical protein